MAMRRMLDEDVPVLDGQNHHGSDMHRSLSISDGVRDYLRPIVTKSSKPVSVLVGELHIIPL